MVQQPINGTHFRGSRSELSRDFTRRRRPRSKFYFHGLHKVHLITFLDRSSLWMNHSAVEEPGAELSRGRAEKPEHQRRTDPQNRISSLRPWNYLVTVARRWPSKTPGGASSCWAMPVSANGKKVLGAVNKLKADEKNLG